MTGELLALGASHKTASLELRERIALPTARAARVLAELTEHDAIHEAVALFTCNRTELYLITADALEAENAALAILSRQAGLRPTELLGSLYSLRGAEAVGHLFSVTGGLDSMIVGEAEIQGQGKRAHEMGLVGGVGGAVSRELPAGALHAGGVDPFLVANRRYDRALGLAQRFGGRAVTFDDMPRELEAADIVVTSTGAPHQILGREELEFVAASRMGRPLVLIDLAVPRDIEPSVRDCPGIALYDMDDLQRAV